MARKKVNDMAIMPEEIVKGEKQKEKSKQSPSVSPGIKEGDTQSRNLKKSAGGKTSKGKIKKDKAEIESEDEKSEEATEKVEETESNSAKASLDKEEEIEEVHHKSVKPNVKKHAHGKKYRKIEGLVEKGKEYTIEEAITLLKKTSVSKFDSAVEVHINLNVDPANSEEQIRGSVSLPAGIGKEKKVCVICSPASEKEARDAGAETIGGQSVIDKIEKGWLDFDVIVATPDMMGAIGKIGKILGTKGLMPNPKTGTVTTEIDRVVKDIKKGKADYRIDKQGIAHTVIGKVSFDENAIKENLDALLDAIHHAKPASVKGKFVKSVYLATTMGPGIRLSEK